MAMQDYIEQQIRSGQRLHNITRHMLGLFHGVDGARAWRRHLSENASKPGAGFEVVLDALAFTF
ncbi:tRNA-dihydrouridine synthase [Methylomonas sp. EFPC3]|uniref:tRNA-dihydrouridine synthase n=1 Tax=Methylomonas sp. EFPC3 TaxID=3021710 RepID=UPI00241807AE|nr:tRNA-dihydrouridine synthase [Methylomonas sp. EFPC3]WFP52069.1 tRNA-dihydrouridine synthase [Methylomonas sp. EFPC3]